ESFTTKLVVATPSRRAVLSICFAALDGTKTAFPGRIRSRSRDLIGSIGGGGLVSISTVLKSKDRFVILFWGRNYSLGFPLLSVDRDRSLASINLGPRWLTSGVRACRYMST